MSVQEPKPSVKDIIASGDVKAVARYIKSDYCKNIFIMAGAGISTVAGIPDFRSPKTGLYANLAKLNLPFPEAVFEINFFRRNPLPFYTLAHELAPGRYRPTLTHSFIRLLSEKGLLHTHFTQNIDTLERRAGVASEDIIEAHGSFATSRCIDCKKVYNDDKMKDMIKHKSIPRCLSCKGLVKPDIVFFGEALPDEFHKALSTLRRADLLLIMGTSLTVHPFASLTELVPPSCPRVLINLELAGDIGERQNDIVLLGECDDIVQQICSELGWRSQLDALWAATLDAVDIEYRTSGEVSQKSSEQDGHELSKVALVQRVVDGVSEDLQKNESNSSNVEDESLLHAPRSESLTADMEQLKLEGSSPAQTDARK